MKTTYKLSAKAPNDFYENITGMLFITVKGGWEEISIAYNKTVFEVYCPEREFLQALGKRLQEISASIEISITEQEEKEWLEAWKEFFTPIKCGSLFTVIPPWLKDQEYVTKFNIVIEPESAFGTGHHASTALCLAGINYLYETGFKCNTFLDLGCGSGILAIGASLLGMSGDALDIDELAIKNAVKNIYLNEIRNVRVMTGSLEKAAGKCYDLILANILAPTLIELAPAICASLSRNGAVILSGILDWQSENVKKAFAEYGLYCQDEIRQDEWVCLILRKVPD